MENPGSRVYYDIIDSVYTSLLNDGSSIEIDANLVADIRDDWIRNIEIFQTATLPNVDEHNSATEGISISDDDVLLKNDSDDDLDKLESKISSYMVCLFAKVSKSKNKWKCSFKQGFIFIENMDIPFNSASGELEW